MATTLHNALSGTELHYSKIQTSNGPIGSSPTYQGQSYFDLLNGILYVANASLVWEAVNGAGGAGSVVDSSSTTLTLTAANNGALINLTSSSARSVTLPTAPIIGYTVALLDGSGSAFTANIAVSSGGSDIFQNSTNLYKIVSNLSCYIFTYDANITTWVVRCSFIGLQPTVTSVNSILGSTLALQTLDTNNLLLNVNSVNAATIGTTNFEIKKILLVDDPSDNTKQAALAMSAATTGTKTILNFTQTANRVLTFPDLTDTIVSKTSTDILTNKSVNNLKFNNVGNTFYTNIIGAATGSNLTLTLPTSAPAAGQTLYSTDTAGTLAWQNIQLANANVAANDSNVVFVAANNRFQTCFPTANRIYTLPTTSILAGDTWTFCNRSVSYLNIITLQSSGSQTITYVLPGSTVSVQSLVNTPVNGTDWQVIYTSAMGSISQSGSLVSGTGVFSTGATTAFYSNSIGREGYVSTISGNITVTGASAGNFGTGTFNVPALAGSSIVSGNISLDNASSAGPIIGSTFSISTNQMTIGCYFTNIITALNLYFTVSYIV